MKKKQFIYALYQGEVMCEVLEHNDSRVFVRFDNGERAAVDIRTLQFTFDLNEGNEE